MNRFVIFRVPGKPAPQGSKRAFVSSKTGAAHVVENSAAVGPWRDRVALAANLAWKGAELLHGVPIGVKIEFILPRPTGTPKTRPTPPAIKKNADIDKLLRAALDALTHTVMTDDCFVIEAHSSKRIAEIGEGAGALIRVEELEWPNHR